MEKQGCWNGMGRRGCMEAVADLLHVEMREVFAVEGVAESLFFLAEDGLYAMAVQADLLGALSPDAGGCGRRKRNTGAAEEGKCSDF